MKRVRRRYSSSYKASIALILSFLVLTCANVFIAKGNAEAPDNGLYAKLLSKTYFNHILSPLRGDTFLASGYTGNTPESLQDDRLDATAPDDDPLTPVDEDPTPVGPDVPDDVDPVEPVEDEPTEPPEQVAAPVTFYSKRSNVLIVNDCILEYAGSVPSIAENYARAVNAVADKYEGKANVYCLVAPTHFEFTEYTEYKNLAADQKAGIDNLYAHLNDNVTSIDAYHELLMHRDQYLYFRSDHHWTTLGGYYAYRAFMKVLGDKPHEIAEYEERSYDDFLGYLYYVAKCDTVKNNPDTVYYYMPIVDTTCEAWNYDSNNNIYSSGASVINESNGGSAYYNRYLVFLGGDNALMKITNNEATTDRKLLITKDSYANAFIPWLVPHFSEIYVVDPRHYQGSFADLVDENNIDNILIMNYWLAANTTTWNGYIQNKFGVTAAAQ